MSGHSKWSTIKRKKEATDLARGKVFSKLSKSISIAVKTGGGPNPDTNSKLRYVIEQAKAANMPKANVERALEQAQGKLEGLKEVIYEGFGPVGVRVMVETATDNRNRTGQEIKTIFERGGGNLAGPGSISFNFEPKALFLVKKEKNPEEQMLALIDVGVDDLEEVKDGIEIYVGPNKTSEMKTELEKQGYKINSFQFVQRPKNLQVINDPAIASKTLSLLEKLEEHDDVQMVYADVDIPDSILKDIKS
jgi:YebC/PmpR family DNA-binding regulatory protein